jgi:hypothetical protein
VDAEHESDRREVERMERDEERELAEAMSEDDAEGLARKKLSQSDDDEDDTEGSKKR